MGEENKYLISNFQTSFVKLRQWQYSWVMKVVLTFCRKLFRQLKMHYFRNLTKMKFFQSLEQSYFKLFNLVALKTSKNMNRCFEIIIMKRLIWRPWPEMLDFFKIQFCHHLINLTIDDKPNTAKVCLFKEKQVQLQWTPSI